MKVKICGLTNLQDAKFALELGASELGFVLAKSPRQIDPITLRKIIASLPQGASSIGVFVNEKPEEILRIVTATGLTGVQLHGQEAPEELVVLKKHKPDLFIFKAVGVKENEFMLLPEAYEQADVILFDSVGSHFDPQSRKVIESDRLRNLILEKPIYLAGGLNAENIQAMIERYHPMGIDLSSSLESSPGQKDQMKMKNLFKRLKELYE